MSYTKKETKLNTSITLGDEFNIHNKPYSFILNIYDHIDQIQIPKDELETKIDFNSYYVTSGDAIMKTKQLCKELQIKIKNAKNTNYKSDLKHRLQQSNKLLEKLINARGNDIFLETEWIDGQLHCIPKNPRNK